MQRIYVERAAYEAFLERFLPKVEALEGRRPGRRGDGRRPGDRRRRAERILEWIAESGGEVLAGGDTTEDGLIRPTVIASPRRTPKVSCEEVFGPVCTVTPYDTLDEAIELANGTRYGLQAGIFTANVEDRAPSRAGLEFGGVTVNEAPTFRADQMPYGGVKDSGNTREGPALRGARADRGARDRPATLSLRASGRGRTDGRCCSALIVLGVIMLFLFPWEESWSGRWDCSCCWASWPGSSARRRPAASST